MAAAILVVVLLFAMLAGKSKDVTSELNKQQKQFSSMQNQYNSMAAIWTARKYDKSKQSIQTVNYDVNINAHGDTPIGQEAAELVADNLADRINAELGARYEAVWLKDDKIWDLSSAAFDNSKSLWATRKGLE